MYEIVYLFWLVVGADLNIILRFFTNNVYFDTFINCTLILNYTLYNVQCATCFAQLRIIQSNILCTMCNVLIIHITHSDV